MKRRAN